MVKCLREELKERLEEPKAIMKWSQRESKGTPGRTKSPYGGTGSEDQCRRDEGPYGRVKSKKYEEMAENHYKDWGTSCEGFPKMQVKARHKEIFEELRERVRRSK